MLFDIANLLWYVPGAKPIEMYKRSLKTFREVGDTNAQSIALNEMAIWSYDQGNLAQATNAFEEMASLARKGATREAWHSRKATWEI